MLTTKQGTKANKQKKFTEMKIILMEQENNILAARGVCPLRMTE